MCGQLLWMSDAGVPDLGGVAEEEEASFADEVQQPELKFPGAYRSVTIEIQVRFRGDRKHGGQREGRNHRMQKVEVEECFGRLECFGDAFNQPVGEPTKSCGRE